MKVAVRKEGESREIRLAALKKTLRKFFSEQPEVGLAYLFGSYVSRAKGPFHDVDIAVFVRPDRMDRLKAASPYEGGRW